MADYNLKTPTKISSDMNELDDASPTMRLSVRSKTQLAAEQDKQKFIANLTVILSLIDTDLSWKRLWDSDISEKSKSKSEWITHSKTIRKKRQFQDCWEQSNFWASKSIL